jgi:hypothetical protein
MAEEHLTPQARAAEHNSVETSAEGTYNVDTNRGEKFCEEAVRKRMAAEKEAWDARFKDLLDGLDTLRLPGRSLFQFGTIHQTPNKVLASKSGPTADGERRIKSQSEALAERMGVSKKEVWKYLLDMVEAEEKRRGIWKG